MSTIAMLTDFGHRDHYVGVMKGVIAEIAPSARVIDLCHEVPPQDLYAAAYLLATSIPYMPEGSVICAVVDPGVGTPRHAVAIEAGPYTLVGPDNGLFEMFLAAQPAERVIDLVDDAYYRRPISHTFHGRDIFSPCAAHIAHGVPIERMGDAVAPAQLVELGGWRPTFEDGVLRGRILHTDHFGNLISSVTRAELEEYIDPDPSTWRVRLGDARLPVGQTFADVAAGDALAYIGSAEHLEVAVRQGSAAERFASKTGEPPGRLEVEKA